MFQTRFVLSAIFGAIAMSSPQAHAQFLAGPTITFDPTQAAHVISQIAQAEKTYTTTVQTYQNVVNSYNLAKRMASAPSSLYTSYGSGLPSWVPVLPSQNTYGNTGEWLSSVNKYTGQASSAIQSASVARAAPTHRLREAGRPWTERGGRQNCNPGPGGFRERHESSGNWNHSE